MYERFYGLADEPFRLTPDPRYLFLSPKHADGMAHLRLGLTESSGFVCITGDVGTGKTTLLRTFLGELGPEIVTAYVLNPGLTVLELLRTINGELGLLTASKSRKRLIDALNAHLLRLREEGRTAVVVIDEAQALPIEVLEQLRLLSNLETATTKLLRVVLLGQPQLRALLLDPALVQLNQRITLRWHLGPLTREETSAYVRHRLSVASDGGAVGIFTGRALRRLHRLSRGVPRLINMIAHRALVAGFAGDRRRVTARLVSRAHRELGSVPLPVGTRSRRSSRARAAVVVGTSAAAVALAVGVGRGPWWGRPPPEPPAPRPATAAPAPEPAVEPMPPRAPAVTERLRDLDAHTSARAAVAALLAAWELPPPADGEPAFLGDLDVLARRRGLTAADVTGTAALLAILDLPAVLELRLADLAAPRYVTLIGITDDGWRLVVGDRPVTVERSFIEDHWLGRAHVLWRDFEDLGASVLDPRVPSPAVARLQELLTRTGTFSAPTTGWSGPATTAAVRAFQREHRLDVDGLVGPLTRIVLYAEAGGYPHPTLTPLEASS